MSPAYLIVAYRSESDLPGSLDAREADRADDATIIVVDNASPDDSADVARRNPSRPEIVASARNLGFGGGCNLRIAATAADTAFLVNPDAQVLPGATIRLRQALADDPCLGVVAPRIVDHTGSSGRSSATTCSMVPSPGCVGSFALPPGGCGRRDLVDADVATRAD